MSSRWRWTRSAWGRGNYERDRDAEGRGLHHLRPVDDRTGFARGTLAPRRMSAAVPATDKPEPLDMEDMMGDMTGVVRARHARTEYGSRTDMRVDMPRVNLTTPASVCATTAGGADVRGPAYGRRSVGQARPGTRDRVAPYGNMERYIWSIDGVEFGRSTPIHSATTSACA